MYINKAILFLSLIFTLVVGMAGSLSAYGDGQESVSEKAELVTRINVNSASAEEIAASLKYIGETRAAAIVAYRMENGPFVDVSQLEEVKGIGPATLEKIRPFVSLQ